MLLSILYLRLLYFGEFPSYPYDGQVHVYTYPNGNQATFTYNSEFNGWMLDGVQTLFDRGMTIQATTPPNFDGRAVSTVLLAALAEPTPFGEMVFTGYLTIQLAIFTYEYIQYINHTLLKNVLEIELCIDKWIRCLNGSAGSSNCRDCLSYCTSSIQLGGGGVWQDDKCPLP